MKKLTLLFVFVFALCGLRAQVAITAQSAYAPNTVVIKHPAAANVNTYFAEADVLNLEVYQPLDKEKWQKALATLRADAAVESCTEGKVNGDFHALAVSLKSRQNKAWFVNWMRSAGFTSIKVNNNQPVALDQL